MSSAWLVGTVWALLAVALAWSSTVLWLEEWARREARRKKEEA